MADREAEHPARDSSPSSRGDGSILDRAFVDAYVSLKRGPVPPYAIRFYPYTSLKSTVRVRDGRLLLRMSDILEDAPVEVLQSAVAILLHRLFRREIPDSQASFYRSYVNSRAVRLQALSVRSERGRKELTSPVGKFFNLEVLFRKLNRAYFEGKLVVRHLSWSKRSSRRILGHWDPAHNAIILNRRLDRRRTPEYVVAFVLYHEMLHASMGIRRDGGRCRFHPPAFQEAEEKFADYDLARLYIRKRWR